MMVAFKTGNLPEDVLKGWVNCCKTFVNIAANYKLNFFTGVKGMSLPGTHISGLI